MTNEELETALNALTARVEKLEKSLTLIKETQIPGLEWNRVLFPNTTARDYLETED